MATRKSYHERPSYIYFGGREGDNSITADNQFEFEESDVWNSNEIVPSEAKKSIPSSRSSKKPARKAAAGGRPIAAATSLPVNIPDWSKILLDEYNKNRRRESDREDLNHDDDNDDGNDDEVGRMPPHVYLARTRTASLSVHEDGWWWCSPIEMVEEIEVAVAMAMAEEEIDEGNEVDGGGGDRNFKIADGWWWCLAVEMVEEIEVAVAMAEEIKVAMAMAEEEIDEGGEVDGDGGDRKLLRQRRRRWWWWRSKVSTTTTKVVVVEIEKDEGRILVVVGCRR
ncbi:hypothetical protein F0562_016951 [Nyssa sinensis]|uniref:Uncharacterized protein n=1 Tax=Nyssa sinensis TaxID=561372 RepID=A0A5J4ZD39_9ASTE|nr:hypothetical protein F0562_016951 [Nyssa sinensis]